jgi:CRP-like cAMP-binding protein
MTGTERFKMRKYVKGDYIMKEGDQGDFVVFISSGQADIVRHIGGNEKKVGAVRAGEIVGEMAVISREPRCASVVATVDTEVIAIDRRTLELALINNDLPIVYELIKQLVARLKESEKRLEEYLP